VPVTGLRERAEHERRQRARRVQAEAARRLRRMEQAVQSRLAIEGPPFDARRIVLDSERYAAPLLERLGARGRVQLLLWGIVIAFGLCAIFSFFSAPLMSVDLAVETVLVLLMLFLSYLM
jgi:hypothetical protein